MSYFKRLKEHPGFGVAIVMTVLCFLAGAANESMQWWVGGVFGIIVCVVFVWSAVLITNIKKNPKEPYRFKPRKNAKKLSLLHYIKSDKSEYYIYNIECLEGTNVSVWIERDGRSILQPEIFDESWGTMGGDSFSSFVISCLNVLRSDIKKRGEFIIKDERIKND
ncbi:MAG: hypothetical protein AABY15_03180 [Nanoarchaeota archaeon]